MNAEVSTDQAPVQETPDMIVVGVDGSDENGAAIRWAADRAEHDGVPLELVTIVDEAFRTSPYVTSAEINHLANHVLTGAVDVAHARRPDVRLIPEKQFGHPARALRHLAGGARLLVLGRRGRGGFSRMLLGSVSGAVGNHAIVPTVVVPKDWEESEHTGMPIVVGIDGSPGSVAALEFAAGVADSDGAEVRAVHVWGPETLFTAEASMAYGGLANWRKEAEELLSTTVDPVRAKHPLVRITESPHQGHVVGALTEESRHARMLVVGGHEASRVHAFVVGSTTHGVLHHACCPVVVVPEPE